MTCTIITIKPNMEQAVSRMLDLLGFEHVWFRIRKRVIYRGRVVLRLAPLFPGYVFIVDARHCWQQIEHIIGVKGFVRFGGVIERVPDRVVNDLRLRADAKGILTEDALPFRTGQPIFLRVGGAEQPGTFLDYVGPARALVDISMFGRACHVQARLGELCAREAA